MHQASMPRLLLWLLLCAAGLTACAQRLPDDLGAIVWMASAGSGYDIWLLSEASAAPRQLTDTPDLLEGAPVWSPDHTHIAVQGFQQSGASLYLLPVSDDLAQPQPIHAGAQPDQTDGEPAWSPDGERLVFVSDRSGRRALYVMGRDGSGLQSLTAAAAGDDGGPDWSPDGAQIVFHRFSAGEPYANIFIIAATGGEAQALTNLRARNIEPAWSPDGRRIAFMSDRDGGEYELYVMRADGREQFRLTRNKFADELPAWSPNGAWLVYAAQPDPMGDFDLFALAVDGKRTPITVVERAGDDRWPAWR